MEENIKNTEIGESKIVEEQISGNLSEKEDTVNATEELNSDNGYEKEPKVKKGKTSVLSVAAIVIGIIAIVLSVWSLCKGGSSSSSQAATQVPKTIQKGDLRIAYINTDTVLAKYDMAVEMQKALEAKQKQAENSFKSAQAALERDYNDFMTNGEKLTLTQQKAKEKELQERMQNLQQMPAKLQTDLQQEQLTQTKKLLDAVYAFVRDYNAKHDKYNVILSKSYISSPTLYIDDGLDITEEIIKGLNEEYKEYKKK
ncbi:MAG: OmpH family outer membrane protein [Bacteroidales bacterium]|nr:OmpH family outer membrane protein [Bacteroidales bacterium]